VAVYLDTDNYFHRDGAAASIDCPHCGIRSHMRVGSVPDFAQLQARRPRQVGIALHCDACNMPVFFRYEVREYRARQIEFFAAGYQIERPAETFSYGYLPGPVATAFKEALACYTHGLMTAFVVMCRWTVLSIFGDLGDPGKLRCYGQVNEVQKLANIEPDDFDIVRRIIFEMDLEQATAASTITQMQAVILLETMKDLLHQIYVRGGKLQKALELRRYFAEQAQLSEVEFANDGEENLKTRYQDDKSIIVRAIERADRE
jgi:hypothetical protein